METTRRDLRFIDDVARRPVDPMARIVTSPEPKWCAQDEVEEVELSHLHRRLGGRQKRAYSAWVNKCQPSRIQKVAWCRCVLGLPVTHRQVLELGDVGGMRDIPYPRRKPVRKERLKLIEVLFRGMNEEQKAEYRVAVIGTQRGSKARLRIVQGIAGIEATTKAETEMRLR